MFVSISSSFILDIILLSTKMFSYWKVFIFILLNFVLINFSFLTKVNCEDLKNIESATTLLWEQHRRNEAAAIVLDIIGSFEPKPPLVSKIYEDLNLIRLQFPEMNNIVYLGNFLPGQLLVQKMSDDKIRKINESEFGPLIKYHRLQRCDATLLEFQKHYNPHQLGIIIKTRFGLDNSPVGIPTFGSKIEYQPSSPAKYIFKSGHGHCFNSVGCSKWHVWNYSVYENGTVFLKEYDS